jgi:ABC-type glutathione transport system ATPase component
MTTLLATERASQTHPPTFVLLVPLVLEHGDLREQSSTGDLLRSPAHPYTRRLPESAPSLSTAISARACTSQPAPSDVEARNGT